MFAEQLQEILARFQPHSAAFGLDAGALDEMSRAYRDDLHVGKGDSETLGDLFLLFGWHTVQRALLRSRQSALGLRVLAAWKVALGHCESAATRREIYRETTELI